MRVSVLEAFNDKARIEKLVSILNRPWDVEAVQYVMSLALSENAEGDPAVSVGIVQKERILALMAYIYSTYHAERSMKDPMDALRRDWDGLFEKIADASVKWPSQHRAGLYSVAVNALEKYGSPDLLGVGFWDCFETYKAGSAGIRALEKLGGEREIQRLQRLDRIVKAWGSRADTITTTIKAIEDREKAPKKAAERGK